jgi:hypothetical protein
MKSSMLTLVLPAILMACAAETGLSDPQATDDADLSAEGVTQIQVNASPGFVAPAPIGACVFRGGSFQVDFMAKTVKGEACIEHGRNVAADRALTDAEATSLRVAIRKVKTTAPPAACPSDIGGTFLSLKRGARESRFADPVIACGGGGARAATGLPELFDAVAKLASLSEQTVEGKLTSMFAIGGETTGMAVETEKGLVELDFAPGHPAMSSFVPDRKAIVVGPIVSRTGVEIPKRDVLLVTDILVCPASSAVLNCQPPTNSQACQFGNRFWIQNNCEGVSFID